MSHPMVRDGRVAGSSTQASTSRSEPPTRQIAGVSVPDGVGDRLDHDAVGGHFHGGRERGHVARGIHTRDEFGGCGQPFNGLGAGTGKAKLVQGRRAQPFDEAPDVDH